MEARKKLEKMEKLRMFLVLFFLNNFQLFVCRVYVIQFSNFSEHKMNYFSLILFFLVLSDQRYLVSRRGGSLIYFLIDE